MNADMYIKRPFMLQLAHTTLQKVGNYNQPVTFCNGLECGRTPTKP